MNQKPNTLIISNMEVGDDTFECDVGSWNVTRARRDCDAGKHKLVTGIPVAEVFENNKAVEVDLAKVAWFALEIRANPATVPPLIFANENGMTWLIEGHHRLRAMHHLGIAECCGYVIEEGDGKPYRIWYNGKRVAPWRQK